MYVGTCVACAGIAHLFFAVTIRFASVQIHVDMCLQLTSADEEEVVVKGLYAVASLVRNLEPLRAAFNAAGV